MSVLVPPCSVSERIPDDETLKIECPTVSQSLPAGCQWLVLRGPDSAAKRGPGLLAGDVFQPVARLAAERGADHDLQVRGLAAVVERRVDHVRAEVHGIAHSERRG